MGVAIVLFTYDGWIDASNVAGEVKNPNRNFPLAMGIGVVLITLIYLLVNFTFLRIASRLWRLVRPRLSLHAFPQASRSRHTPTSNCPGCGGVLGQTKFLENERTPRH